MPFQRCCVNAPPHVHRVVHGGSTRVSRIRPHCLSIELPPNSSLTDLPVTGFATLHHLSLMVDAQQIRDTDVVKGDTIWVQPKATVSSVIVRFMTRQLTLGGWGRASGVNAGHFTERLTEMCPAIVSSYPSLWKSLNAPASRSFRYFCCTVQYRGHSGSSPLRDPGHHSPLHFRRPGV
jgi:hypothetical protein